MKLFVAGGAGYVGSHCVRELIGAGHEVVVFDNLNDGGHAEAVDPRAECIVADLSNRDALEQAFATHAFDAVMHFAAHLDVGESVAQPLKYYRNNISNTIELLDAMRRHEVRKLVFSSTCATYGEPDTLPITEELPQAPINPYGRTKLAIEWALQDSAGAWGLGATALRYFNASGASSDGTIGEDRDPEYHLIPLVLQVALGQRKLIKVFGTDYPTRDGTCVRDYIHVEDLASAHRLAIESQPPATFRAYNVGTGLGVTVRELIEISRSVCGCAIPSEDAPRRPGDPPELYADPTKLKKELGWNPKYTRIEPIIQTAWQWHRTHPKGYATEKPAP
ncbi:MAG: UDP-glucose 4-epimerase GalE [Phycisphaerae bacterium]